MNKQGTGHWRGDAMGGLTAMVMCIPGNLAFGMIAFSPLGDDALALGVTAAMFTSIIIGLASGIIGGIPGMISGPQATSAMLFAALLSRLQTTLPGAIPDAGLPEMLTCAFVTVFLAGVLQLLFGLLKVGTLVKFIPFPVTTGFFLGAVVLILGGQLPTLTGIPVDDSLIDLFMHADEARLPTLAVAIFTIAVMVTTPRLTTLVPPTILALFAGTGLHYALQYAGFGAGLGATLDITSIPIPLPEYAPRFLGAVFDTRFGPVWPLIATTALSLAVLNTVDSLLCVVALQNHLKKRPRMNLEQIAQGAGNAASALFGGLPGAGFISRTLVNYRSGGGTRWSSAICSLLLLGALYAFAPVFALLPKVVLSAILVAVLVDIIDPWVVKLFRKAFSPQSYTHMEFVESLLSVLLVVFITLQWDLTIAVGAGVLLSGVMFIVKMTRSPIRQVHGCATVRSKRMLDERTLQLLEEFGNRIQVIHLDGVLFFGTVDRVRDLLLEQAKDAPVCIILEMRRVGTLDSTGMQILLQTYSRLEDKGIPLFFASLSSRPRLMKELRSLGFFGVVGRGNLFDDLDRALEAGEDLLLKELRTHPQNQSPDGSPRRMAPPAEFQLDDFSMFQGLSEEELDLLSSYFTTRKSAKGTLLFSAGDASDGLYLIASGSLEVFIDIPSGHVRLVTMAAGAFIGEMTLIENLPRSASVQCLEDTVIHQLTPEQYQAMAVEHPRLAIRLLGGMLTISSERLRRANEAIRDLSQR